MSAPLRTVALFEAAKGLLVLLAGFGAAALVHRHVQPIAEQLVGHLHLNPAKGYPRIFLDLADQLTDTRLWLLAVAAAGYALVRFIEAYGLWTDRSWAKWFAALSGGIYIPFELREIGVGGSWPAAGALVLNILVVAIMAYDLSRRKPASGRREDEA